MNFREYLEESLKFKKGDKVEYKGHLWNVEDADNKSAVIARVVKSTVKHTPYKKRKELTVPTNKLKKWKSLLK